MEEEEIGVLVAGYPYSPFRRCHGITGMVDRAMLSQELGSRCADATRVIDIRRNGVLSGLGILSPLDWETSFFGLPMVGLRAIVSGDDRDDTARMLFEDVDRVVGRSRHITLRVDAEDIGVRLADHIEFERDGRRIDCEHHAAVYRGS